MPSRPAAMPHVFNEEEGKFEQVHAKQLDQRPSKSIQKRQRNGEYMKFLLACEQEAAKKAELRGKRRAALKK